MLSLKRKRVRKISWHGAHKVFYFWLLKSKRASFVWRKGDRSCWLHLECIHQSALRSLYCGFESLALEDSLASNEVDVGQVSPLIIGMVGNQGLLLIS